MATAATPAERKRARKAKAHEREARRHAALANASARAARTALPRWQCIGVSRKSGCGGGATVVHTTVSRSKSSKPKAARKTKAVRKTKAKRAKKGKRKPMTEAQKKAFVARMKAARKG